MTAPGIFRMALWAAFVAGMAAAGEWSVRLGRADAWFRTETVAGTEKALALTPDQAAYSVRLALLVTEDDPARAVAALRRAVALDPSDARAWIELGLRYEAGGNGVLAERALLRAAQESRTYLPRWTLANFYYRRGDTDRFWQWAKAAVPMIWGDPLPLFQLCGRVSEDGELLGRLDIRQPQWRAAYLFYLLDEGRADLAGPAVRRLMESQREAGTPLLLRACDRLLEAGRAGDARAIWDGLVASRGIRGSGGLLFNGDFAAPPSGHGFDWRLSQPEGVSAAREETPAGLRLTFSGGQAESIEPMAHLAAVEPDTAYELRFDYRTSGIAADAGPRWRVADASRDARIAEGESLASEEPITGSLRFQTPPGCRLLRITLACQRRPGAMRIAGFLILRNVKLLPAGQPPSGIPPRSRVM